MLISKILDRTDLLLLFLLLCLFIDALHEFVLFVIGECILDFEIDIGRLDRGLLILAEW